MTDGSGVNRPASCGLSLATEGLLIPPSLVAFPLLSKASQESLVSEQEGVAGIAARYLSSIVDAFLS